MKKYKITPSADGDLSDFTEGKYKIEPGELCKLNLKNDEGQEFECLAKVTYVDGLEPYFVLEILDPNENIS